MKPSKETRRVEGRDQPGGTLREEAQGPDTEPGSPAVQPRAGERGGPRAVQTRFTALLHHVDVGALERAFRRQKRQASAGVDGITVADYEQNLEANLQDLCARVHTGRYRPQPVRRVYIPKADGGQRPLGVPTLEDKIVQGAVAEMLSAIYEVDFLGFSYGFRPGRNPHQALDVVAHGDHEPARELGARCRHPQLLRLGRPRVAAADAGAQDRRSARPPAYPDVARGRYPGER